MQLRLERNIETTYGIASWFWCQLLETLVLEKGGVFVGAV